MMTATTPSLVSVTLATQAIGRLTWAQQEIDAIVAKLQKDIEQHTENDKQTTEKTQNRLQNILPRTITKKLQPDIAEKVREEVAKQVQVQVDEQIGTYIPIALDQQIAENRALLRELNIAKENS